MAMKFTGPGGSDSNNGLTYANRKLTFAGLEAILSAGDQGRAAPGIYPESLTAGASGSSGSPVEIVGDVSGQYTDGVGGPVILIGSNDGGATVSRANCINNASQTWRTYKGLTLCCYSGDGVLAFDDNCIFEACMFDSAFGNAGDVGIIVNASSVGCRIRRCIFYGGVGISVPTGGTANDGLVENCILIGGSDADGFNVDADGWKMRNCTLVGQSDAFQCTTLSIAVSVYNSVFSQNIRAIRHTSGSGSGVITEDYNNLTVNGTARLNTATGSNSLAHRVAFARPGLGLAHGIPEWAMLTSSLRDRASKAGDVPTVDYYGNPRLRAAADIADWGAVQHPGLWVPSATFFSGSRSSQVTGVGFKHWYAKKSATGYNVTMKCRVTSGSGTPRPYVELLDGDGVVVATATASATAESTWEDLVVAMPANTLIPYRVRAVNPDSAKTVLFDKAA